MKREGVSLSDLEGALELMRSFLEATVNNSPDSEGVLDVKGQDGIVRLQKRDPTLKMRTKFGTFEYGRTGISALEAENIMHKDASLNMPSNGYSFEVQSWPRSRLGAHLRTQLLSISSSRYW